MQLSRRKLLLSASVVPLLGSAAAATPAQPAPLKIRSSYVVPVSNWAPLIVAKKDLARHWGKSYVLEATRYQGTPPMITALATSELDIADLAYSTLGIAIQNAGIGDLKVVADELQDGVPGYFSNLAFVRKDSGIKTIEDLKGKVLATNAIGSGIDIAVKAALKKHGLLDKRDYTVIEAPFPAMAAMLREKKVDLAPGVPPFAFDPFFAQQCNVLFDQTAGIGRSQFAFWAVRESFIRKNRAALVDLFEDVIRIERWYLDPDNHAAVETIASGFLHLPPDRFGWLFRKKTDYYRDPSARPDLEALQRNVDTAADLGFFRSRFDVKHYSDLSL
ncbi:MAG: ABC transporter substrate-binding protein, partial [Xanthobacteraceae bacterium]